MPSRSQSTSCTRTLRPCIHCALFCDFASSTCPLPTFITTILVLLVPRAPLHLGREQNADVTVVMGMQLNAFEVASDAFNTFKRLLTQHDVVADFLLANHDRFFRLYEQLLQSKNYATQRQVRRSAPHSLIT
jgi:hypothetical protein